MERQRMLMVMIPGTDHTSWNDHESRIAHQPPDIVDQKVDNEVNRAKREHKKNREPIRAVSKHKKVWHQEVPDVLIELTGLPAKRAG
jgi:hypothetical protein